MPARLSALIAELESGLKALPAYAAPNIPITFGLGAKEVRTNGGPPRIIWVPTSAAHSAPGKDKANPRRCFTREVGVVAHCWGESLDATEQLVHDLIYRLHKSAWGSIQLGGEEWPDDAHVELGLVALVRFVAHVPVETKTYQTVVLTTVQKDTTGSTPGDGNIDWGEP